MNLTVEELIEIGKIHFKTERVSIAPAIRTFNSAAPTLYDDSIKSGRQLFFAKQILTYHNVDELGATRAILAKSIDINNPSVVSLDESCAVGETGKKTENVFFDIVQSTNVVNIHAIGYLISAY